MWLARVATTRCGKQPPTRVQSSLSQIVRVSIESDADWGSHVATTAQLAGTGPGLRGHLEVDLHVDASVEVGDESPSEARLAPDPLAQVLLDLGDVAFGGRVVPAT